MNQAPHQSPNGVDEPVTEPAPAMAQPHKNALFSRGLGADLTSLDWLKALAVTTMIIDHIGYYFMADSDWWRLVGRFSAPIWLFLIGFALTHAIPKRLVLGAILLVLVDLATMEPLFPLNILASIIIIRWALPIITKPALLTPENLLPMVVVLGCLALPSWFAVEYGVLGLLFALFGHLCRRDHNNHWALTIIGAVCVAVYTGWQYLVFEFTASQTAILGLGTTVIMLGLYRFQKHRYADTGRAWYAPLMRFLGRYTLEIYVGHLVLFGVIAYWLADFGYFDVFLIERPDSWLRSGTTP
ncbi:MAG: TraX family protein [Pseudomonadota bacterium]